MCCTLAPVGKARNPAHWLPCAMWIARIHNMLLAFLKGGQADRFGYYGQADRSVCYGQADVCGYYGQADRSGTTERKKEEVWRVH